MPADGSPTPIDLAAFRADVDALHAELKADLGPADVVHLRKMLLWSRLCTLLGYALAWPIVNPLAVILIGYGNASTWCVAHPILHRGYDAVPGVPDKFTSRRFAQGWRRFFDWFDWIHPAAWAHEHNGLHHYHTGQRDDPDFVQRNARLLRETRAPRALKWVVMTLFMATWKLSYYAPNTFWAWKQHRRLRQQSPDEARANPLPTMGTVPRWIAPGERVVLPVTPWGLEFWARCVLPYGLVRFGLIPALFLPLGTTAWAAVLVNSLLAEIFANLITFLTIAPNHTGEDVHAFDTPPRNKAEFYLHQAAGSVNYPGGRDLPDFLQGFLNYQIEHHFWPDLPLLKYRQAAPRLKAICAKHGVPYIQQSVFRRFGKLWAVLMGDASMQPRPLGVASMDATDPQTRST